MAFLIYGQGGTAFASSANPSGFGLAWSSGGGTFPTNLTDSSDATYEFATITTSGDPTNFREFSLTVPNDIAKIPTNATLTSVDVTHRLKKSADYFAKVGPGTAVSSFGNDHNPSWPTITTAFADYTQNLPTDHSGAAWTFTNFFNGLNPLHEFAGDLIGSSFTVYVSKISYKLTLALVQPVLTTDPATLISSTVATLNGTLTETATSAFPVTYYFDWGTTPAYGNTTTATPVTSDLTSGSISAFITGLTPLTTYHFRFRASNDDWTVLGSDASFTTTAGDIPIMVL
jgi:hypothetical protein